MAVSPVGIRPARPQDVPTIRAMLAPAVRSGEVLPRAVLAEDFLVAEDAAELVGVVALTEWSESVVELGSLVASRRGCGVGARLVAAAMEWAALKGYADIVALTSLDDWFGRRGFVSLPTPPWALARHARLRSVPTSGGVILQATVLKAQRSCSSCHRLGICRQVLMHQPASALDHRRQRVA